MSGENIGQLAGTYCMQEPRHMDLSPSYKVKKPSVTEAGSTELLLTLAKTVIPGVGSSRTRDHILLSHESKS
jgi:hypothetical protein